MRVYITGHRIQDIGGFEENSLQKTIRYAIRENLRLLQEEHGTNLKVLTSLSLGIETWAAEICQDLKINTHVYIPFKNPHGKWSSLARAKYKELLKQGQKKIVLDTEDYSYEKLMNKDVKMIEDADEIYGFFSQKTIFHKLLEKANKDYINLMPEEDTGYFIKF